MNCGCCKENCDETSLRPAGALYVHVPLCVAKCRYCDFYSLPFDAPAARRLPGAIARELELRRECLALPLVTVFIGGGTPTALGPGSLAELLAATRPLIDTRTEFSVEANPGTFDPAVARTLRDGGVNRVNFGVQSFRDGELAALGRIHSARQAHEAIRLARETEFEHVGLDLIYGIPGQSLADWQDNVREAVRLEIDHLSCYALSFEEDTPLGRDLAAGLVAEMPEAMQKECYYQTIEIAAAAGLEHYEISNFARPAARCRHNLTYWRNEPYLGLGPAAASYVQGVRRTNTPDLAAYLRAIDAAAPPPCQSETLSPRVRMAETAMLALRMIDGLDRTAFGARFGLDVHDAFPQSIPRYVSQGALELSFSHLRLARWSLFACDTILADIVAEANG